MTKRSSINLTVYNMNKAVIMGDMLARRMVQLVHCIVDGYFIRTYVYRWILYVQKILKRLPKEGGMSILDWEEHYINKTRHLWADEQNNC